MATSKKAEAASPKPQGPERKDLTADVVKRIVPNPKKEFWVWDVEQPALAVRVRPSGSKTFYLRIWEGGRQRWIKIESFPKITPDQARKAARVTLAKQTTGTNLSKERKESRTGSTMKELATLFLEGPAAKLKPRTLAEYNRELNRDILPKIGSMRVKEVTFDDLERLHKSIEKPVMSNRIHALLHRLFEFAERRQMRPPNSNPAHGHEKAKEQSRTRYADPDELIAIGKGLDDLESEGTEPLAAILAIRFLLFSGMRREEVLTLEWRMVRKNAQMIHLEDSKGGIADIDINPFMQAVLDDASKIVKKDCPYVFPSRVGLGHFVGLPRIWVRVLRKAKIMGEKETLPPVRLHDLRRTFAVWGVSDASLTDRQIGTVIRHKSAAITDVYAKLVGEARKKASSDAAAAVAKRLGMGGA